MDTFNFNRFWLTLKTLVVSERKRHIRTILISFVSIMCYFSIPPISVWNAGNISDTTYIYMTWYGFISFFFVMMLSVAPSLIMWGYDRKEQRITHFILPASRLEKFIALVCVSIVVNFAYYFIGVLLADIMQWLILTVSGVDNPQLVMAEFFRNRSVFQVSGTYVSTVSAILFSVSILLCSMSIYLLGGVFFRRYSWLFTSMVLFFIFIFIMFAVGKSYINEEQLMSPIDIMNMLTAIMFTVACLNVWLSYWLYSRLQVINNKWINI